MDVRSIQQTGKMRYVYLPTKWCKEHKVSANSKVVVDQKDDGSIAIIPELQEEKLKQLNLNIDEESFDIIQKLIVACYINPTASFKITLKKPIDHISMLKSELVSLELVEIDKNEIICESVLQISDPQSLLRTTIRKIKNMLIVMSKNYHAELIERYESEIDRNKLLINKAVIGALTYQAPSKLKTIDLYYIGLISSYIEAMVDHLIEVDHNEKDFLGYVSSVIDELQQVFDLIGELDHKTGVEMIRRVKKIPEAEVKDMKTYHKYRVKKYLMNVSEVVLDWAITKEIEK